MYYVKLCIKMSSIIGELNSFSLGEIIKSSYFHLICTKDSQR